MSETVILVGVIVLLVKELVALVRWVFGNGAPARAVNLSVLARDVADLSKKQDATRRDIHDLRDAITPLANTVGLHEWRLRALEKREEGA